LQETLAARTFSTRCSRRALFFAFRTELLSYNKVERMNRMKRMNRMNTMKKMNRMNRMKKKYRYSRLHERKKQVYGNK
jgi:hypothetical protein